MSRPPRSTFHVRARRRGSRLDGTPSQGGFWRKKGRDLNVTLMSLRYMCRANPAEMLIHGSNEENQENPYSKGSVHV